MRGVVHFSVTVTSGRAEQHSGMDGKMSQHEPLKDLTALLAELSGTTARGIEVPNFHQAIKVTKTKWEDAQYEYIASTLMQGHPEIKSKDAFIASLEHRWQQPNLTVHQISVPDSKTAVTISGSAQAAFSIRIVPDQTADSVALATSDFLQHSFEKIGGRNKLEIKITSMADPWLADPEQEPFNTFKSAIVDVWYPQEDFTALRSFPAISSSKDPAVAPNFRQNRPTHRRASSLATRGFFNVDNTARGPLFIREGGSIPALRILEKEFKAKAVMFPMGQASDNAHLFQERMRVENLYKGKEVLKKVFSEL
jgi:di- and tripeptidase